MISGGSGALCGRCTHLYWAHTSQWAANHGGGCGRCACGRQPSGRSIEAGAESGLARAAAAQSAGNESIIHQQATSAKLALTGDDPIGLSSSSSRRPAIYVIAVDVEAQRGRQRVQSLAAAAAARPIIQIGWKSCCMGSASISAHSSVVDYWIKVDCAIFNALSARSRLRKQCRSDAPCK